MSRLPFSRTLRCLFFFATDADVYATLMLILRRRHVLFFMFSRAMPSAATLLMPIS